MIFNNINRCVIFLVAVLLSCTKIEDDLEATFERPGVMTQPYELDWSLKNKYPEAVYPQSVLVGDTILLAGRFHLNRGGTITLGLAKANITLSGTARITLTENNSTVDLEVAQFVVTREMGEGPQPLLLEANGIKQFGPDINILTKPAIEFKTDTTLVLEELFNQSIPGYATRYYGQSGSDFFPGKSVTDDGTIYLQSTQDIYRFHGGVFESILKLNDPLTLGGENIVVTGIAGMTADPANTTLYLSINGSVSPQNGFTTAHFLLKKDLSSDTYTVINKTLYGNGKTEPGTIRYDGPVNAMPVSASALKLDAKNRLLFLNTFGEDVKVIFRVDEHGDVKAVLDGGNTGKAYRYVNFYTYSPDGLNAYIAHENNGIMRYDLEAGEPVNQLNGGQQLSLISYEHKAEYAFTDDWTVFTYDFLAPYYLVLPSGEFLWLKQSGRSIGSILIDQASTYAYAGLENGYVGKASQDQNQLKGLARYVNFGYTSGQGRMTFIGVTSKGEIYFKAGGGKDELKTLPPRLYRLVKP